MTITAGVISVDTSVVNPTSAVISKFYYHCLTMTGDEIFHFNNIIVNQLPWPCDQANFVQDCNIDTPEILLEYDSSIGEIQYFSHKDLFCDSSSYHYSGFPTWTDVYCTDRFTACTIEIETPSPYLRVEEIPS